MNKIVSHIGDKFSIYLLVVIVGAMLLYYSFGYVPVNELRLEKHATQILENKALAIADKYRGYANAVNSAPVSYLAKWFFQRDPKADAFYVNHHDGQSVAIHYSNAETLFFRTKITRRDYDFSSRVDQSLVPALRRDSIGEVKRIWSDQYGDFHFVYTNAYKFEESTIEDRKVVKKEIVQLLMLSKISDFMSNLKENDFFEDMFLVRANTCHECKDSVLQKEIKACGNFILDRSKTGLVEFVLADSAEHSSSGIYQETIHGKQYKVHYQMLKLRQGVDVYLIGIVPLDVFKTLAKRVSVWFIVFCSLGALLLIFLFPILKLFLLSEGERMNTRDVSFGVFSVMLCSCLCSILAIGYYYFWGLETTRSDVDVKALARMIKEKAVVEIDTLYNALKNVSFDNATAKIDSVEFLKSLKKHDFNQMFILELTRGRMLSMFTVKEKKPNLKKFPVSVGEREYFKAIRDQEAIDYFLQSVNSYSTGKRQVAMSAPIMIGPTKYVGVVTSPLHSIMQAGVPSPYEFILLDNKGDIKFHSGWTEIKTENFLSELENDMVARTYLENTIEDHVDFTYLRVECRGYLIPIVKDWSVLVYYKRSEINSLSAQVFMLCLVSLLFIVLFCVIIHLCLKSDRRMPVLLKTTPFLYAWLNPNNFDSSTWRHLFRFNLYVLATEIAGMFLLESFTSSFIFSLMCICTVYSLNYFVLKPKPTTREKTAVSKRNPQPAGENPKQATEEDPKAASKKSLEWAQVYEDLKSASNPMRWLAVIFLFLLLGFFVTANWAFWLLSIGLIGCMGFGLKRGIMKYETHNPADREPVFLSYRRFMVTWLAVVIIGPSIGFLAKHYQNEKIISTYASLIADVQKLRGKAVDMEADLEGQPYYYHLPNDNVKMIDGSTDVCNPADVLYYGQLPKFSSVSENNSMYQFTNVPTMKDLTVKRFGNILQVSATTNSQGIALPQKIERQARLETFGFNFGRPLIISLIAMLILIRLVWWVQKELPLKFYYLPEHAAWKSLPSPPLGILPGNFKFEFSGKYNELHLLHGIDSKLIQTTEVKDDLKEWEHEKLILDLQDEQYNHYSRFWERCSDEEKFFLFDLAEDGAVNHPEERVIRDLVEKKLLRLYPRLEIVNVSFANFVRSVMQKDELLKMERQESKDGRWKQVRVLLIIIIIAAVAFLSIAEENFFGRATALIGSITLLLPNVLNLLGSVTRLLTKGPPPANP